MRLTPGLLVTSRRVQHDTSVSIFIASLWKIKSEKAAVRFAEKVLCQSSFVTCDWNGMPNRVPQMTKDK